MSDLPLAAVARIAKNNGAERIGDDGARKLVEVSEKFIQLVSVEAVKLANHAGRKTIKEEDVVLATNSILPNL